MKKRHLIWLLCLLFIQCANPEVPSKKTKLITKKVKTGIEVLRNRNYDILKNKKVGLVTNPTGVDSDLKSTIDILYEAEAVNLVALYGPEHGVRGNYSAGEYVKTYTDKITGVKVYSLYGKQKKPTKEMLEGVEVLVYDIQDIGCRSYTYISTMGLVMEAAAEFDIEVVILDRPNPIGGNRVEGTIVQPDFTSFVSQYPIPYIYGLTCGELAQMFNEEGLLSSEKKCKLSVVTMEGWERSMTFAETGLEWVPTSPHIPHQYSAYFYPISGILGELPVFNIGVGYTLPFQAFAADWITDANQFAEKMNEFNLPGIIFRPVSYKPYYGANKGTEVNGVQVHITDFQKAPLSEVQFRVMEVNNALYPDKNPFEIADESRLRMFDLVCGTDKVRKTFATQFQFDDIKDLWNTEAQTFKNKSVPYYLYK